MTLLRLVPCTFHTIKVHHPRRHVPEYNNAASRWQTEISFFICQHTPVLVLLWYFAINAHYQSKQVFVSYFWFLTSESCTISCWRTNHITVYYWSNLQQVISIMELNHILNNIYLICYIGNQRFACGCVSKNRPDKANP